MAFNYFQSINWSVNHSTLIKSIDQSVYQSVIYQSVSLSQCIERTLEMTLLQMQYSMSCQTFSVHMHKRFSLLICLNDVVQIDVKQLTTFYWSKSHFRWSGKIKIHQLRFPVLQFVAVITLPGHEDWVRAVDFTVDGEWGSESLIFFGMPKQLIHPGCAIN